jgi:hypothetical protein
MKFRMTARFSTLLSIFAALILVTPAIADWEPQFAVNAGYVAQTVEDPDTGEEATEWSPTALTGIQFFKTGSILGFSAGVATLPDEEQTTPRVAPYAAVHFGSSSVQFYAGGCYDSQNGGDNDLVATFGMTAAF